MQRSQAEEQQLHQQRRKESLRVLIGITPVKNLCWLPYGRLRKTCPPNSETALRAPWPLAQVAPCLCTSSCLLSPLMSPPGRRDLPAGLPEPLVSLAEPQATSVNSEISHPGRSSQTHGVAALCFLLKMEALKFLSLLMLRL